MVILPRTKVFLNEERDKDNLNSKRNAYELTLHAAFFFFKKCSFPCFPAEGLDVMSSVAINTHSTQITPSKYHSLSF